MRVKMYWEVNHPAQHKASPFFTDRFFPLLPLYPAVLCLLYDKW